MLSQQPNNFYAPVNDFIFSFFYLLFLLILMISRLLIFCYFLIPWHPNNGSFDLYEDFEFLFILGLSEDIGMNQTVIGGEQGRCQGDDLLEGLDLCLLMLLPKEFFGGVPGTA